MDVGPTAWRVIVLLAVLGWGGPIVVKMIDQTAGDRAHHTPLSTYYGRRGPWIGWMTADGRYQHDEGPTTDIVLPGETLTWDTNSEFRAGTTASTEFRLWCAGRIVYVEDRHLYATERRHGWMTVGMKIPTGLAPGQDCAIRIHVELLGENGETAEKDFPSIQIRIGEGAKAGRPTAVNPERQFAP